MVQVALLKHPTKPTDTHLHQRLLLVLLLLQLHDLLEAEHHLHRFALPPAVASLPLRVRLDAAGRRRSDRSALRQLLAVAHKVQVDVVAVRAARARQSHGGGGRGGRTTAAAAAGRRGDAAQRRPRRPGWRRRRRWLAVPHDDGHGWWTVGWLLRASERYRGRANGLRMCQPSTLEMGDKQSEMGV